MKTNRKIKFENIIVIDNWDIDFEASQVRLNKILSQQKQEMVEEIDKYICENKGIYPFPTIEEEVAREIQDLIITSNKT